MAQEKHDSPDPIEVFKPDLELQIVPLAPTTRVVEPLLMVLPLSVIDFVWSTPVKRGVS
jgi:hypothetical protein